MSSNRFRIGLRTTSRLTARPSIGTTMQMSVTGRSAALFLGGSGPALEFEYTFGGRAYSTDFGDGVLGAATETRRSLQVLGGGVPGRPIISSLEFVPPPAEDDGGTVVDPNGQTLVLSGTADW